MGIADAPCGIFLNAVDETLTVDVRGDAVEHEIPDRVGHEVQLAIAVKVRDLQIDVVDRFLVGNDIELVELILMFVEEC